MDAQPSVVVVAFVPVLDVSATRATVVNTAVRQAATAPTVCVRLVVVVATRDSQALLANSTRCVQLHVTQAVDMAHVSLSQ